MLVVAACGVRRPVQCHPGSDGGANNICAVCSSLRCLGDYTCD